MYVFSSFLMIKVPVSAHSCVKRSGVTLSSFVARGSYGVFIWYCLKIVNFDILTFLFC